LIIAAFITSLAATTHYTGIKEVHLFYEFKSLANEIQLYHFFIPLFSVRLLTRTWYGVTIWYNFISFFKITIMAIPVLGMSRLDVGKRILATRAIVIKMTGSTVYTASSPSLTVITASVNLLEEKKIAAKNGTPAQTTALRTQNKAHLNLMNNLLLYIATASGGDKQKIEDIGLSVKRNPGSPINMTQVLRVWGTVGGFAGVSALRWMRIFGAKYYLVQKSPDGLTDWVTLDHPPTKTVMVVTGLVPETASYYRVAAGNGLGIGSWSDPIKVMAM